MVRPFGIPLARGGKTLGRGPDSKLCCNRRPFPDPSAGATGSGCATPLFQGAVGAEFVTKQSIADEPRVDPSRRDWQRLAAESAARDRSRRTSATRVQAGGIRKGYGGCCPFSAYCRTGGSHGRSPEACKLARLNARWLGWFQRSHLTLHRSGRLFSSLSAGSDAPPLRNRRTIAAPEPSQACQSRRSRPPGLSRARYCWRCGTQREVGWAPHRKCRPCSAPFLDRRRA
jgi:hypothetical protein